MAPLLTVGVPVYNGMPYLKETMASLFGQTFSDFKILVINDGSKDDSLEYLQSLRDPRLKVVSQQNRGLTSTLNRMLAEIDTPWLVRQDADDISLPDRTGILHQWATRCPEAGLLYSRASHYQRERHLVELQTTAASPDRLRALTKAGHLLSICHTTVAVNARKLLALGGYRFNLYVEDYDMYWRMALATELQYIPKVLVGARIGGRGISGSNSVKQAMSMLWVQYLLMSEVLGLQPLDYPEAVKVLEPLLPSGLAQYRMEMRKCLDCIGDRRHAGACLHMMSAAVASPRLFANRVSGFLKTRRDVVLGMNPAVFKKRKSKLWPDALKLESMSRTSTLSDVACGAQEVVEC